jgi:CTP synthase
VEDYLEQFDGVLVAPGFGKRGIEGKIKAIQIVREKNIPFFGICLGMQCAVVEFSRNVIGLTTASSTEVNANTDHPVIDLMPEQKKITKKGGTMRLGAYNCKLKRGSKAYKAYGKTVVSERHRHRYEFNNEYLKAIEDNGLVPTGVNPESNLVEIVELKDHPFFIGVQYHPELKSTVENPHPLFVSFVAAAMANKVYKN